MQGETPADRPILRLGAGQGRRLRAGAPWVFSNEIAMRPEYRRMVPGGLVRLEGDDGGHFGTFMFNPHSLIAARLLDRDPDAAIDAAWMRGRLAAAMPCGNGCVTGRSTGWCMPRQTGCPAW